MQQKVTITLFERKILYLFSYFKLELIALSTKLTESNFLLEKNCNVINNHASFFFYL